MPKTNRPYKLYEYSAQDLEQALEKLKKGESFRKVSEEFKIPKSTLFSKLKGFAPINAKKGPQTTLTEIEENRLKKWILDKARLGFPMHSSEVQNAVKKVLDEVQRETLFKDNKPGEKWLNLFLKRHPEIKKKNTEVLSKSRASVTEEKLRGWFCEIKNYLDEHNLTSVLDRPESIWNGDETGYQLNPKSARLLGPRKERNFYEISAGHEKETITVLCSFSAAGASIPPMITLPYKRIPAHLSQSVPPDWSIGRSDSGWMVSSTFYEYMVNVFYPWCIKNDVQFPVIYFLDGHKSHLSLELSDFCREHFIILVSLFPNSTHIIQPCDVSIFKALKSKWRETVQIYKQESQTSLTKANFAPLFKKTFDQLNADSIKNGFRKCGLYPFDENAVDYEQCISHRRKQIELEKSEVYTLPLELNDILSTKKFFEFSLGKEKIKHFIKCKESNENNNDPVYLLWKTCIENLELLEAQVNPIAEQISTTKHERTKSNNLKILNNCEISCVDENPALL